MVGGHQTPIAPGHNIINRKAVYKHIGAHISCALLFSEVRVNQCLHTQVILPGPGLRDISVTSWPRFPSKRVSSRPTKPEPPPINRRMFAKITTVYNLLL